MSDISDMCVCGHKSGDHNDESHNISGKVVLVPGHGPCSKCACRKYTWTDKSVREAQDPQDQYYPDSDPHEEYDPGPEIDDEGGMSDYQYDRYYEPDY